MEEKELLLSANNHNHRKLTLLSYGREERQLVTVKDHRLWSWIEGLNSGSLISWLCDLGEVS